MHSRTEVSDPTLDRGRRLFANHGYRMILLGATTSSLGDRIYEVALMWYVLQKTGSVLQTGSVPAFSMLAPLTLGIVGGAMADRLPRKQLMLGGDVIRAAIVAGTAVLVAFGALPIWYVYLSAFLLSAVAMVYDPASVAVLPDIVDGQNLAQANAYLSGASRLIQIVGRGVGGVAVAAFGAVWAIGGNSLSFLISAACILIIRFPSQPPNRERALAPKAILQDTADGIRYLTKTRVLRALIIVAVAANLGGGLTTGVVPVLAQRQLGGTAATYGLLLTGMSVGEFAGMLLMGVIGSRIRLGHSLAVSLIVGGAAYVGIALVTSQYLAIALFALEGIAIAVGNVPIRTLLQTSTPSQMRGRIFSGFVAAVNLGSPIAAVAGAALTTRLGIASVYTIAGIVVVIAGAWATYAFKNASPPKSTRQTNHKEAIE